jgi:hypothetical protein
LKISFVGARDLFSSRQGGRESTRLPIDQYLIVNGLLDYERLQPDSRRTRATQ